MGRLKARIVAVTIVSACGFSVSLTNNPEDAKTPDAGPCQELGVTCAGDELRRCLTVGALPTIENCHWGCIADGNPHCGEAIPGGGAVLPTDLGNGSALGSSFTLDGARFDTDNGQIEINGNTFRGSGSGVRNGIDFANRSGVGVFRFRDLTINGNTTATGSNALAIVALGTITLNGAIDMQGGCSGNDAGPGGSRGGSGETKAPGATGGAGGSGGSGSCSGGGGGSYGTTGGTGGSGNAQATNPSPGALFPNANIAMLVGGGGGGGGGGDEDDAGDGGGGGGAIQLFAVNGIVFAGSINASGCGGGRGASNSCGGGGGAGGAILLESKTIMFGTGAKLAVNGGGGGGGDGSDGAAGQLLLTRAAGGSGGGGSTGSGGSGGASVGLPGLPGGNANNSPGGGGGGVGWMRFNTLNGSATITSGAICSPQLTDPNTTVTQGKVKVQ